MMHNNRLPVQSILIADDDIFFCRILRQLLSQFGIRKIYEAHDGAQALEMISQNRVDFLITDWDMPIVSGEELVRMLVDPRSAIAPDTPILMIATSVRRSEIERLQELGIKEILIKPFSAKALFQRMHRMTSFNMVAGTKKSDNIENLTAI